MVYSYDNSVHSNHLDVQASLACNYYKSFNSTQPETPLIPRISLREMGERHPGGKSRASQVQVCSELGGEVGEESENKREGGPAEALMLF